MKKSIYFIDVFTNQALAGNPLAVVISGRELPKSEMQKIAAEINYSETTFLTPVKQNNNGYSVKIYTPSKEIEFAGHPILGTAYIIRKILENNEIDAVNLNLPVGQVAVSFEPMEHDVEVAWFKAPKISFGDILKTEQVAPAIGLTEEDIDIRLPIQVIAAGTAAIMVPINTLEALFRSGLNLEKCKALIQNGYPPLFYLFCNQTHDEKNDFCVRFFFEAHGPREDPATGNGAAFFGAYLLRHQFEHNPKLSIRIEQGYALRRPSLIMLRAQKVNSEYEIHVGGSVVSVLDGELTYS